MFHFPHFFLKFQSVFLIFSHTLLLFFLIFALQVGESPIQEGHGYATGSKMILIKSGSLFTFKNVWLNPEKSTNSDKNILQKKIKLTIESTIKVSRSFDCRVDDLMHKTYFKSYFSQWLTKFQFCLWEIQNQIKKLRWVNQLGEFYPWINCQKFASFQYHLCELVWKNNFEGIYFWSYFEIALFYV